MGTAFILILLSMLLSGLCSGLEIAYVSSNKLYFELQRKEGSIGARLLAGPFGKPSRLIGVLLVGNNIAMVVYGLMMAQVLEPALLRFTHSEVLILLVQTMISTIIILFFAEFLPKALFRLDPNGIISFFAIPLRIMYSLLWLPMMVVTGMSELVLRAFGVKTKPGQVAFGRIDLDEFLKQVSDNTPGETDLDSEVEYFRNTLELSNTKVRDVMVPRAEIEALDVDDPMPEVLQRFTETGMSKLLVYKDNVDNIIGYIHSKDMFRRPAKIRSVLRTVNFIPGTMPADLALQMFTNQRTQVAVVVDEFGGTAGMLTIEDVVEVIVGDIEDEHDTGDQVEERIGEDEFLFSARIEVDEIVDRFRLNIPVSEEYDTLAGHILHNTGGIPEPGEEVVIGPFSFTVAQVTHGRIDLVRVKVNEPDKGYLT